MKPNILKTWFTPLENKKLFSILVCAHKAFHTPLRRLPRPNSLTGFTPLENAESPSTFRNVPKPFPAPPRFLPHNNSLTGFTLLETLVAVFILAVAITATMSAAFTGLRSSYYSRDQITASYLAQEAMEYVRAMRDENWANKRPNLNDIDWLYNLANCKSNSDDLPCDVDVLDEGNLGSFGACPEFECRLYFFYNDNDMGYTHNPPPGSGATPSNFRRIVTVDPEDPEGYKNSRVARITVTVIWTSAIGGERSIVLRENLYNWYIACPGKSC